MFSSFHFLKDLAIRHLKSVWMNPFTCEEILVIKSKNTLKMVVILFRALKSLFNYRVYHLMYYYKFYKLLHECIQETKF